MPGKAQIKLRVEPSQYTLLTKAAALLHKGRNTFIIEAVCREAENIILDQRLWQLNDNDFMAFETALTAKIPENAKLKALLS